MLFIAVLMLMPSAANAARTDWPIVFPAFRNDSGDASWDWLSTGLPEAARTKLHGTIYMRAFTWEEINQAVTEDAGLHGEYIEISKRLRSDLLVIGSYNIRGEAIEVIGQCIDPVSGRPLATYSSMGSIHEPAEAMNELLLQIAPALRLDLPPEDVESIRRPATSVADALKAHSEGLLALTRETSRESAIEDAITHFRDAISLDPAYADPHYRLATLLQHKKDIEGAEKAYRQALNADVDHRDARYRLGLLLIDQDRKSEAMTELEQALTQSPEDPQMQTALSSIWFDQYHSNFNQMADQYKQAIAANPDDAQLYVDLGGVYDELSQVENAAKQYRLALERDANHADANYKLGMIERNLERPASAETLFRRAIQNGTELKRAHFYLGEMLVLQKKHKQAAEAFAKAVKTEPNNVQAYARLGKAYSEAGNHQDALLAYHQYSQLNKKDARPHVEIGKAYLKMGLEKQAMTAFEKSIQVDPKFAEGHIAIGDLLNSQKLTMRATKSYKEAIRLQPDHARAAELKTFIVKYQPAPSGNRRQ
jgi:tetratricopeptide (TPR) repeat protein